jgi:hypothetical protein
LVNEGVELWLPNAGLIFEKGIQMRYPQFLTPTSTEEIVLPSGRIVHIPRATPVFRAWAGEPVGDSYGGKPVVEVNGEPAFAELAVRRMFCEDGWDGVWVDTYRNVYRIGYGEQGCKVTIPSEQEDLLGRIYERAGARKGCWDVYCWRNREVVFAEMKQQRRDRIRDTQRRWLEAALDIGLPLESFLVVEWCLGEG